MGQKAAKDDASIQIFKQVNANVVVISVRKSGLSAIMERLHPNKEVCGPSSMGNAVSTIYPCKGVSLTTWGIGFGLERPPLWKYHLKNAEGLLLIVDSGNRRTLVAMKEELAIIFKSEITAPQLPVVVMANKTDLPNTRSAADIADALALYEYPVTWNVQCCSAVTGEGLTEGVRKLFELIRMKKVIPTKGHYHSPIKRLQTF